MVGAPDPSEFSGAFTHAAIGMALVDPSGRYLRVNLALCRMLGYTEDEFLELTFTDLTHPDDLDDHGNVARLLSGEIESFQMEKRYRHRQGHFVRGLLNVSVVRDEAGAPRHQIAQIQDLTRDDERRAAEARYRTLFEHAPDGILIGDPQSTYLDANPSMCRMLGYEREELIGRNATDIIDASQTEQIPRVIAEIKALAHHHQEWRFKRKDGATFPVEVMATLMPDGNLLGMVRDISDRKGTEKSLRDLNRALAMLGACNDALIRAGEEEALLQEICRIIVEKGGYRIAAVGFAMHDAEHTIALKAYAGETPENLRDIPRSWASDRAEGAGPAGRAIRSGEVVVVNDLFEEPGLTEVAPAARAAGIARGVYLPLRLSGQPLGVLALYSSEGVGTGADELKLLRDLADNLSFGIGSIRHRVEREKADEALRASLDEKQALLKEVHHRVKNNMQVITSLLRIEGRRIDHPVTRGVLDQMQGRIQSMALLHETLYRSGTFARVDLAAYLGQLANQLFRSQVAAPGSIQVHLDLESVAMSIDHAIPCGLIVNELASNSLKHGFADGRSGDVWIRLATAADGKSLILSVWDNGPGLPEDFDRKRSRSLGLQLVSDLARQLQGTLEVGSGREARFEVTFPRTRMATVEIPPLPRNSAAPSRT